jgi:hypothetical protein
MKCATLFHEEYVNVKNKGTLVTSGTLTKIIDEEKKNQGYLALAYHYQLLGAKLNVGH